jgi:hypothetical protein
MSDGPNPSLRTPQYRTLLLRRLKNMFPGWTADIQEARHGLSVQLFDEAGRPRGKKASLTVPSLERSDLIQLIGDTE